MAAHTHDVRLRLRSKTTNSFIWKQNTANHAVFLTVSPMRSMFVEKIKESVFFMKNEGVISFI